MTVKKLAILGNTSQCLKTLGRGSCEFVYPTRSLKNLFFKEREQHDVADRGAIR